VFAGIAGGIDLRRLPERVPVPKVESSLTMDFDVEGQFANPFIRGGATFGKSMFLDAAIGQGATGSVDTSGEVVRYAGNGDMQGLQLARVASEFELDWLSDPRYDGEISGRFAVEGVGSGATIDLSSRGRLERATLFGGRFHDADVTLDLRDGSLAASYSGRFVDINPALAFADERLDAMLTGGGRASIEVDRLLVESPTREDYTIAADLQLDASSISGLPLDAAAIDARLAGGLVSGTIDVHGPALEGTASGRMPLDDRTRAELSVEVSRADLEKLGELAGQTLTGTLSASGRISGALSDLRTDGSLKGADIAVGAARALGVEGDFTLTTTTIDTTALVAAAFDGSLSLLSVGKQSVERVVGSATYDDGLLAVNLELAGLRGASGILTGAAHVAPDLASAAVSRLAFGLNDSVWELVPTEPAPVVLWSEEGVTLEPMAFTPSADPSQRLGVAGTWRVDGTGRLDLTAERVQLTALTAALGQPDSYGGLLNLDATLTGTAGQPIITGDLLITDGRVRQLAYEQLFGRIAYVNGMFELGVRLDQAPGVWLTASGAFPLGLIDRSQPEAPMHIAIASTPIGLGLVEGLTDVVRSVTGQIELNISAVGTSHDPRFTGQVRLMDAGFVIAPTGARYQRANGTIVLTRDRMTVDALRIYDADGSPLDVRGSVGTDELRLQDIALDVVAREFEVLRNQYGTVQVDARLMLTGRVDAPVVTGNVSIADGELRVDRILDRMLFSPYATEAAPIADVPVDAIAALNPWERVALDIELDVPNTLRLVGDSVQVAAGTPLGVGDIDLRVAGNLFLRKPPGGELVVIGGLDRLTGRYAFQGRRFDLDPASTVSFAGELDPELSVTVTRIISGVETRVAITGRLSEPELQLASNPPLDPTDILSLIVFNTSVNQLTLEQQEQLAVRAGTLAAGFLTAPLLTALERTLGLDVLEVEAAATGARVTIGDEIAPGLVARFSRQFGAEEYDEATIEYYLSRLFRIRATFSDAGSVVRSPFRRVERAGIDLLLFFSF
jgi:autotransporter translocation and assembly factor TamB